MRRHLATLLPLAASIALSAGLCPPASARDAFYPRLTWSACPGDGGVSDIVMPCASGTPVVLVATFELNEVFPPGLPSQPLILQFTIDLATTEAEMPDFWYLSAPDPASGCPPHMTAYCGNHFCGTNPFLGPCLVDVAFTSPPGTPPNRLHADGIAYDMDPRPQQILGRDTEYYLFELLLNLDAAVESGGPCNGCRAPVTIGLTIRSDRYQFTSFAPSCVTANGSATLCDATPARAVTWGLLKSLYR